MKKFRQILGIFLVLSIILASCTDDYFEFDKITVDDWKPELALPLVNSSLSLSDIIQKSDTNGIVNPNPSTGLLEVIYEGRVFSTNGAVVINLPTQNFLESFELANPITPDPNGGSLQQNFKTTVDFRNSNNSIEIDSLALKDGQLTINIENDFEHEIAVKVTFPTFKDNLNNPLVLIYNVPAAPNSSSYSVRSKVINIGNYKIDLTKDENGNNVVNKFPVFLETTFTLSPNVGSNNNDRIRVKGRMKDLEFEKFYGYTGYINLDIEEDSIPIDLFRNFVSGIFFLSNPFLDVTISNSFGVPIDLTFEKIAGYNPTKNPAEIDVIFPIDPQTGQRNVRRLNTPTNFGLATTEIECNVSNSNIDDVISYLPKQIVYDSKVELNPTGKTSTRNFLSDTSQIGLDVYLRLPFEGHVSDFLLIDTIDFKFENTDEIEKGLIRMRADNGFPVESQIQIIFTDSLYQAIDSLYPEGQRSVIPSAIINSNGESIQNSVQTTDVEISGERIKLLNSGRYIIIQAELNSTDAPNQNVKFYDDYRLDINLGLKATIVIN